MKQKKVILKNVVVKPSISMKRRIRLYVARFFISMKVIAAILIYLFFFTTHLTPIKRWFASHIADIAADSGVLLENVMIAGQNNLSTDDIIATLNADVGTPLLSINLGKVRQELLKNDWVKDATIERRLPNILYVNVTERIPIAIWQKDKRLYLVDEEGHVIAPDDVKKFVGLTHIIGDDAPANAASLNEELGNDPELRKKLISAIRYGDRRWNLILDQGITIKMPEINFARAYRYLSKLNEGGKLFDNSYKVIDLRDEAKYFFEKNEENVKNDPKKQKK
ncbi:MAG: FtsQ-type POTRA domain-containing protein [Rickettsiaceae bacterium]|nr:FtsQ-type POTRA domain-containing protein [Rickettsiaceae bacterium]